MCSPMTTLGMNVRSVMRSMIRLTYRSRAGSRNFFLWYFNIRTTM